MSATVSFVVMMFAMAISVTCRADIYRWDNGQMIHGTEGNNARYGSTTS